MRRALTALCLSALLLTAAAAPPARAYTYKFTTSSLVLRWPTTTINIVLSTSLQNPPANIKAGSDVEGAARRALRRWADAADISFNISVGSEVRGIDDGINLISVAIENGASFNPGDGRTGTARTDFDPTTGLISEADMFVNPNQPFSTDGTHNTYDLESTFVHEIGHVLGLDHSGVVGASMQPRQVVNFFDLKQASPRTLSADDIAGIRTLYGRAPRVTESGSIAGAINYGAGAHVFAESVSTGRVHGSAITQSNGSFRIDHLPQGAYRVVVEHLDEPVFVTEVTASRGPYVGIGGGAPFPVATAQTSVTAGATSTVNLTVGGAKFVNLRAHGLNVNGTVIIHGGPMPLAPCVITPCDGTAPGRTYRYYVAGDGIAQIPAANFSTTSPFIVIDPASYAAEGTSQFGQVVSFNIRVADNAKVGEYSLRVQSEAGEVAYLAGALVVDPYADRVELNPVDAHDFFVRQQYLDFLFRTPDSSGFQAWLNVLNNCPNAFNTDRSSPSARCDRAHVSSGFFRSPEFELKGLYIYRFYRAGLNRQPTYAEFVADMQFVTRPTSAEVIQQIDAYPARFAGRGDFQATLALPNDQYVNTLMGRYGLESITTPDPANPNGGAKLTLSRADLIGRLNAGALTKLQVLRAVADSDQVSGAEFNRGFVTMQYFGYLKRDPDESGFNAWLGVLNRNPSDFYSMVNGFMNSQEYRTRFGQP